METVIKWHKITRSAGTYPKNNEIVLLLFSEDNPEVSLGYWSELDQEFVATGGDFEDNIAYPDYWAEFNTPLEEDEE